MILNPLNKREWQVVKFLPLSFDLIIFTERQKQKKMDTKLYRDRKKSECPDEAGASSVTAKQDDVFNRPANANQVQNCNLLKIEVSVKIEPKKDITLECV